MNMMAYFMKKDEGSFQGDHHACAKAATSSLDYIVDEEFHMSMTSVPWLMIKTQSFLYLNVLATTFRLTSSTFPRQTICIAQDYLAQSPQIPARYDTKRLLNDGHNGKWWFIPVIDFDNFDMRPVIHCTSHSDVHRTS